MRWRTYRRLEAQYERLQNRWMADAMGRLLLPSRLFAGDHGK
jgi:hypothetical protein